MTPETRNQIERNTGVLIDVVIEDTPAFYSNIMAGDVLISIDGIDVRNAQHAHKVIKNFENAESLLFKVLRNGEEKELKLNF